MIVFYDSIACVLNEYQGNGFDKEHGLKTFYWNFREYLEKYEEDFLFQMEMMYDYSPFERKDNRNRKNKQWQKGRDDALYQYLWRSFESELSHANEVEFGGHGSNVIKREQTKIIAKPVKYMAPRIYERDAKRGSFQNKWE